MNLNSKILIYAVFWEVILVPNLRTFLHTFSRPKKSVPYKKLRSNPILGPKVPYFVPGGVTQLMIPALHLNPSTLVPATKAGDHHAPQGPQGLQTPDLLCINCPRHNISSKILHIASVKDTWRQCIWRITVERTLVTCPLLGIIISIKSPEILDT